MILVGELSLWIALLVAVWATIVSWSGALSGRDAPRMDLIVSGRRAIYATFVAALVASIGLWDALLRHDFSLAYVASESSSDMPVPYVIAAFWSGPYGSILFGALCLASCSAIAIFAIRRRDPEHAAITAGTLGAILAVSIAVVCLAGNPFARLELAPADGSGLDPQLQNPGMALHLASLFLGYAATAVPFALAIAALVTRRLDNAWVALARRWSLVSWSFLTTAIVLGMWWSYRDLGRAAFWTWDAVDNALLMTWLACTAALHSMIIYERRGAPRAWTVVLVVVTFELAVFGSVLARADLARRTLSQAPTPEGAWFAAVFAIVTAATVSLSATRFRHPDPTQRLGRAVSRETALFMSTLVLCVIAFAVLVGTLAPAVTRWATGLAAPVSPAVFDRVEVPLGLLLLALLGIAPMLAWGRASLATLRRQTSVPAIAALVTGVSLIALGARSSPTGFAALVLCAFCVVAIGQEFYAGAKARRSASGERVGPALAHLVGDNRRRYGAYIVHLGILALVVGLAGLAFDSQRQVALRTEQSVELRDPFGRLWRFTSQGPSTAERRNMDVYSVALDTWVGGTHLGFMQPEERQYVDANRDAVFQPLAAPAIRSAPSQDVSVSLADVQGSDEDVIALTVRFTPLAMWVWIGGFTILTGGLVVMWPRVDA